MASYRKRGAHAARPATAPFVAVKRVPQTGAPRSEPVTGGNRGSGRKMRGVSGLRTRTSLPKVIAAMLVIGFGAVGFAGGLWFTPAAEPTARIVVRSYPAAKKIWVAASRMRACEITSLPCHRP